MSSFDPVCTEVQASFYTVAIVKRYRDFEDEKTDIVKSIHKNSR